MKQNWPQVSIIVFAGVVALALLAGALFRKPLSKALFSAVARSTMARRNMRFDDGHYVGLCGTGSPMPDAKRMTMSEDGMLVSLPVKSKEVSIRRAF